MNDQHPALSLPGADYLPEGVDPETWNRFLIGVYDSTEAHAEAGNLIYGSYGIAPGDDEVFHPSDPEDPRCCVLGWYLIDHGIPVVRPGYSSLMYFASIAADLGFVIDEDSGLAIDEATGKLSEPAGRASDFIGQLIAGFDAAPWAASTTLSTPGAAFGTALHNKFNPKPAVDLTDGEEEEEV